MKHLKALSGTCALCDYKLSTIVGLTSHLRKHNISSKEYYDLYVRKDGEGYCANCGKPTKYKDFKYLRFCSDTCSSTFLWREPKHRERQIAGRKRMVLEGNNKGLWVKGQVAWNKGKRCPWAATLTKDRLGKTYEELYGVEKAMVIKNKQKVNIAASWTDERREKESKKRSGVNNAFYGKKHTLESIKKMVKNRKFLKPTSYERKFIELCKENKLPYKFVGNGEIWIGKMNPDFINTNGLKIVVETYCNYWHKKDYEITRRRMLAKYGFTVLFLDDSDLGCKQWKKRCLTKLKSLEATIL